MPRDGATKSRSRRKLGGVGTRLDAAAGEHSLEEAASNSFLMLSVGGQNLLAIETKGEPSKRDMVPPLQSPATLRPRCPRD